MHFEKEQYENFVKCHPAGNVFQSLAFGQFQDKIPYRGKSWALFSKNSAGCLAIKIKLPFNFCWLWIPYGPLGFCDEIFEDLGRIAKEENAIFARIEPPSDWRAGQTEKLKKTWRIRKSFGRYTPENTLAVDVGKNEDEILAQMKPKGRYNIQIAKKHGVKCGHFEDFEKIPARDFNNFYEILKKTSQRDEFGIHPKTFYGNLLKILCAQNMASLFLAYIKEKVVAGIIAVFYRGTAVYYYGASDYEYRNLMAPYLLQWEAMREAKKRGLKFYDLLGIAPEDAKKHPWAGVTEFKKKFGGEKIKYPEAFDIVYKPVVYKFLKVLRKIRG